MDIWEYRTKIFNEGYITSKCTEEFLQYINKHYPPDMSRQHDLRYWNFHFMNFMREKLQ